MKNRTLTDQIDTALKAIETIQVDAGRLDKRVEDAEHRAAEAEKKAERDREAREKAEGMKSSLEAKIVETRASVAAEVETLKAEKEMLALRDRQSREELERLRPMAAARQIKSRGVTVGG